MELTHLSEVTNQKNDSAGFITELLADHDTIIDFIRGSIDAVQEKYNDAGTSDYITGFIETHEKMAWMLRAHLK